MIEARHRADSDEVLLKLTARAHGYEARRQGQDDPIYLNLPLGEKAPKTVGVTRSREERDGYASDPADARQVRHRPGNPQREVLGGSPNVHQRRIYRGKRAHLILDLDPRLIYLMD
ncbi:hypothetical protein ACOSQ4_006760 [Xanthoceras sorbifolium]